MIRHKRFRITGILSSGDQYVVDEHEADHLDDLAQQGWEIIQSEVTVQEVYPEGEITSNTRTTFELSMNILARKGKKES